MTSAAVAVEQALAAARTQPARRGDRPFLLVALVLAAIVYVPLTRNFFIADDFVHLYQIVNWPWQKFLLVMHGGHLYMTRNALFLLWYRLFGMWAAPYFWLVLITHLLNVFLLFRIIRELTDSAHLACLGAALWGMLPGHDGVLGWYSVYGHALAATFTLAVLFAIVRVAGGHRSHVLAPLLWVMLLLAAATSFGVGIGAAVAMPVAALLLVPAAYGRLRIALVLGAFAVAMPFIYLSLRALSTQLYGGLPSVVIGAHFWRSHVQATLELLAYGLFSIVVGVFQPLVDYPGALSNAIVALCVVGLAMALVSGSWTVRGRILACLAIAAAVYGVIATGRWMFTKDVAFASTARYHYLGTAALTVAICVALGEIGRRWRLSSPAKTRVVAAWAVVTLLGYLAVGRPIQHFDLARKEAGLVIGQIRRAAHTVRSGTNVYIENAVFRSVGLLYVDHKEQFPGWAGVFSIYFPDDVIAGRRVRFVESDIRIIELSLSGRRTAGLMVPPQSAGQNVYRWAPSARPIDQPTDAEPAAPSQVLQ